MRLLNAWKRRAEEFKNLKGEDREEYKKKKKREDIPIKKAYGKSGNKEQRARISQRILRLKKVLSENSPNNGCYAYEFRRENRETWRNFCARNFANRIDHGTLHNSFRFPRYNLLKKNGSIENDST